MQFNGLSEAQAERLEVLAEECAETIQIICKIKRHGYGSRNPLVPDSRTNRELLEKELGHVMNARDMCIEGGDVDPSLINAALRLKSASIHKWLHHQGKT